MAGGVIDIYTDKSIGDFLAVGTDVLDGGGGGKAGDFAESFDASETLAASVSDDVVPVFAAHDSISGLILEDSTHAVDDDDARETVVVTNSVGAATEGEGGEIVSSCKAISVGDFFGFFDFENIASGAAEAHSSKTRN